MSYRLIHRGSGNSPWAFDTEAEARACAEEASEDGEEWAVVRMGPDPTDNEVVATYPETFHAIPEPAEDRIAL